MRVPSTINTNCLIAYKPVIRCVKRWHANKLRSYSINNWDYNMPKSLRELCVIGIAKNWKDRPILDELVLPEDRYFLLDLLLLRTLPLQLSIPIINDEIYWKKCYIKRWPKNVPKIKDDPFQFVSIVRNELNVTHQAYISHILGNKSDELVSNTSRRTSLKLNNLDKTEGHGRTWKKHYCEMHLKEYLEGLKPEEYNPEKHELETLDLSHCKIGDRGAMAIAKLTEEGTIKNVILTNNRIALYTYYLEGLLPLEFPSRLSFKPLSPVYANYPYDPFLHPRFISIWTYTYVDNIGKIIILGPKDISLNQFYDDSANTLMETIVDHNKTIKTLIMSGCGLTKRFKIAENLKRSNYLENIDISNNNLEEVTGTKLLEILKYNVTIKHLDLRMCKIPSQLEFEVQNELYKNTRGTKTALYYKLNVMVASDGCGHQWDENMVKEMEDILHYEQTENMVESPDSETNYVI